MSVHRTIHVKKWWMLPGVQKRVEDASMELGVFRAKVYAPVDTGLLRRSIRRENRNTYGSTVRYAVYQEGEKQTYTNITPFLSPSAKDVAEAMPKIVREAIRRMR